MPTAFTLIFRFLVLFAPLPSGGGEEHKLSCSLFTEISLCFHEPDRDRILNHKITF